MIISVEICAWHGACDAGFISSTWHYVLASRRPRVLPSIAAMQLLLITPMLRPALHLYAKHTGICAHAF